MPIPVVCVCGPTYHVGDEFAGRQVRCPHCGQVLTVPQPVPVYLPPVPATLLAHPPAPDSNGVPPNEPPGLSRREDHRDKPGSSLEEGPPLPPTVRHGPRLSAPEFDLAAPPQRPRSGRRWVLPTLLLCGLFVSLLLGCVVLVLLNPERNEERLSDSSVRPQQGEGEPINQQEGTDPLLQPTSTHRGKACPPSPAGRHATRRRRVRSSPGESHPTPRFLCGRPGQSTGGSKSDRPGRDCPRTGDNRPGRKAGRRDAAAHDARSAGSASGRMSRGPVQDRPAWARRR